VGDADFWVNNTQFVFSSLHTWGWITNHSRRDPAHRIAIAARWGAYGRFVGLVAAMLGAVGALLDVGGEHPWWALGVFAICVVCIHGLAVMGEPEQV
jgi:hypothetical protein